jgi:hypothetical protein
VVVAVVEAPVALAAVDSPLVAVARLVAALRAEAEEAVLPEAAVDVVEAAADEADPTVVADAARRMRPSSGTALGDLRIRSAPRYSLRRETPCSTRGLSR